MAIYSFWIFDRHCNCIYNREWSLATAKRQTAGVGSVQGTAQSTVQSTAAATGGSINVKNDDHAAKLLFGALFSLKQISSKLSPSDTAVNNFRSFSTAKYRCHFFESGSGLKLCFLTDPSIENMQFALKEIYTNLYIGAVVRNGLSPVDFKEGEYIDNDTFITGVDNYVGSLQAFKI